MAKPKNKKTEQIKVESWTPQKAKAILAKGGPNRRLSDNTVTRYATAMSDGRWSMNGETIKISRAGKLLDGQHRLQAVILSGKNVEILTVRGLMPKTQATVDDGFKRNLAHVLDIAGEKHSTTLAFALSLLRRWDLDELNQIRARSGRGPRRDECVDMLKKYPDIRNYVGNKFTTMSKRTIGSAALFATCWYICSKNNNDLADFFYEQLATGVGLSATDPVYLLRERLLASKLTQDPRHKLDTLQKLTLISYAWNATVENRQLKQLKLSKDEGISTRKISFK